jgi:hypothetical protein
VTLIASGYRYLAYMFLAVFVLPVMTLGCWQLYRRRNTVQTPVQTPKGTPGRVSPR